MTAATGLLLDVVRREVKGRLDREAMHERTCSGCDTHPPERKCYIAQARHAIDAARGRGSDRVITIYDPCAHGEHGDCIGADDEPETRPADLAERCACACHPLDAAVTEALSVLYSVAEDGCACLGESCSPDDPQCDQERASVAHTRLAAARKQAEATA